MDWYGSRLGLEPPASPGCGPWLQAGSGNVPGRHLKSEPAQSVHEIEDTKDDHDEARANLVVNDEDSLT